MREQRSRIGSETVVGGSWAAQCAVQWSAEKCKAAANVLYIQVYNKVTRRKWKSPQHRVTMDYTAADLGA
jgi:hypothetical protein